MSTLHADEFYNALAEDYDNMTQFAQRLEQQEQLLSSLLPARRAFDMGCGTGLHSIALARLGVEVTGIDVSTEMLARARRNADAHEVQPEFIHGDYLSLPPAHTHPADLLLCLGNSLPHIERNAIDAVLLHWHGLLAPGGRVLLQLLNYSRVLEQRERIVNIRRSGANTVVRFYDFLDDALQFNILGIHDDEEIPTHFLRSTRLTPFTSGDILTAASNTGYARAELFSSLAFARFTDAAVDCVALLTV